MSAPARPRAVLLDALGTLVELDDPFGRLVEELRARGAAVRPEEATAALEAEMRFYRAEHGRARDEAALETLRDDCAEVLRDALPSPARDLPSAALRGALLAALRFAAFPEVPAVLRALRAAGHPLVVVSNWDVSLHHVLAETELAGLLDGVLTSAQEGVEKPAPELFARALRLADRGPHEALHVGDSVEHDVAGARAAGLEPVLVDRCGRVEAPAGVARLRSLRDLPALAARPRA